MAIPAERPNLVHPRIRHDFAIPLPPPPQLEHPVEIDLDDFTQKTDLALPLLLYLDISGAGHKLAMEESQMTWMHTPFRRAKVIVPEQAITIADHLHQISEQGQALAVELRRLQVQLNDMWEGKAKERFMGDFDGRPGTADSEADFISAQANRIASMKVTIWETISEWTQVPD
ncbi:MAG: hypothetical protein ACC700_14110 [Anaerolineales bacterium]